MASDRPYIAKCNHCNPKVLKTFTTEKGSHEWGRDHELTHRLMSAEPHVVHYAMKASAAQ